MTEYINIVINQEKVNSETIRVPKDEDNKVIHYESGEDNKINNRKISNETGLERSKENQVQNDTNSNSNSNQPNENGPQGSIWGAIFAMTSLSIGTGCLTFTKKVIEFGFVWFGVVLIIGGFATYWTLSGLIRSAIKKGDSEYSSIVRKEIGKFPAVLVDVMTCLYSWGLIITYEIIMNSLVGRVIYVFFQNKDTYPSFSNYEEEEWNTLKIRAIVLGSINLILIILCLVKDIGRMKIFNIFGIAALFYTIIVLVAESPLYWKHYLNNVYIKEDKSTHANWVDISRSFNPNLDFFTGFATIVFSFSNHQGALPVYRSVNTKDESIMNKIFRRSIILDLIIYFLIYIASFLTAPLKSEDLIIFRESIFDNDIFMNLAKISIFLELFFLIPSNYNSFRCSLFHILFGNENVRTIPNIILTAATLIISALIGVFYSEISNYISLLGGFCCTTYCYFVPGWLMIKVEWEEMSKTKRILSVIGIATLTIFGYIGGIMSVIICFRGRV